MLLESVDATERCGIVVDSGDAGPERVAVVETAASGEPVLDGIPAAFHAEDVRELLREALRAAEALRVTGITLERGGYRLRVEPLGGDRIVRYVAVLRGGPVADSSPVRLTRSERKVCELATAGLTKSEIAERLGLSPHTVKTHLRNAYQRLGVGNRVELTRVLSLSRPG